MLISQKSKEIIDSCRFCWMCRHICPIGNATGQERNTSRARALALSMVERGAAELADCIDNVYECALCEGCTNDCATGWDPVKFTKEVRREAALEGVTPEYVTKLIDDLEKTGNIYGKTEYCSCLDEEAKELDKNADTLLFIGAEARYLAPKFAASAIKALKKAGVSFTVLSGAEEPDSGLGLDTLVSDVDETKKATEKAAAVLNKYKTVIVLSPNDMKLFAREYKEWGTELTCKLVTLTSELASLVKDGKLAAKKSGKTVTYQDPAMLARELEETEPAREFIGAYADITEMLLNRKFTMLGGNLIMNEYIPDVMKLVAKNRIANATDMGASIIVTATPDEYKLMSENAPEGVEVLAIAELAL